MPKRSSKRDTNELAKSIVDQATSEQTQEHQEPTQEQRSALAKILGRLGGLKGGPARAAALGPDERQRIAKRAAKKRWGKQE